MDIALPPTRRKPIWIWLLMVIGAVGAFLGWLPLTQPATVSQSTALQWQEVKRGTVNFSAAGVGELYASDQRAISALENGYIANVLVQAGDTVASGDVLMVQHNPQLQLELEAAHSELRRTELDAKDAMLRLSRELAQAAIQIDNAKADLDVASSELNSYQQLVAVNSVSRLHYEQALANQRKSQNSLNTAMKLQQMLITQQQQIDATWQENLALATLRADRMQQRVDSLTIRAGQPGIIKDMLMTAGDGVNTGTRLAVIGPELPDSARLHFPQRYSEQLKVAIPVELTFLGQVAQGIIVRVSPDLTQGAVVVEMTLAQTPASARIGMSVRANAQLGQLHDALYIETPFEADPYNQIRLWREIGGKQSQQLLSDVISFNGLMVFKSDLSEGERIAIDPQL